MRMIDADTAKQTYTADLFDTEEDFERVNDIFDYAPTVDAVVVTRCENCAFSQSDGWVCGGTALMPQHRTFPNSFCSDGERKDGT